MNDERARVSVAPSAATPATAAEAWWRGAVIYECHLPSFRDGNGDGVGDLDGLIASLDYLKSTLGVDAVWTGPFTVPHCWTRDSTSPTTWMSNQSSAPCRPSTGS